MNIKSNGVYKIVNKINNKSYIGSTADKNGFWQRWKTHRRLLKNGKHSNQYLLNEFIKYGEGAFAFIIVEICEKEKCIEREQYFLDLTQSYDRKIGYNLCKVAGNTLGRKHSEATKKKIGQRHYPKPWNKNKSMSEESKHNMSEAQKKSLVSQENIKKLNKSKRKSVMGIHVETGEVITLAHTRADERFLSQGIVACCNGRWKTYKGFKWNYLPND